MPAPTSRHSSPVKAASFSGLPALRAAHAQRIHRAAISGLALVVATSVITWAATRPRTVPVVVTARTLAASSVVTAQDVRLQGVVADALPSAALTSLSEAIGMRLSGAASRGEVLTSARVAPQRSAGGDVLIVGFIVDAATAGLLRVGDLVDVFSTVEDAHRAEVVGSAFEVAGIPTTTDAAASERMVYLRVPPKSAAQLLAAKAHSAISIALRQN